MLVRILSTQLDGLSHVLGPQLLLVSYSLAGDAPDGLVLSGGVGVARPVRVYLRSTAALVQEVMSASDGSWEVSGLSGAVDYDVQIMGTAIGEKDVFVPNVRAS